MAQTIGILAWLFHTESSNVINPLTDHLLHYPIRKQLIAGFLAHVRIPSAFSLRRTID
jgi:hypothetical protein